jgi:hypothetical protein
MLSRLFIKTVIDTSYYILVCCYRKLPPYDFLNLYGACLQALRTPDAKSGIVDNLPTMGDRHGRGHRLQTAVLQSIYVSIVHSGADYLLPD